MPSGYKEKDMSQGLENLQNVNMQKECLSWSLKYYQQRLTGSVLWR